MDQNRNRAARRLEARKARNKKNGLAALSLLATTGLMSSYVALLRNTSSYATTPTCELEYTVDKNLPTDAGIKRYNDLSDLSNAIRAALDGGTGPVDCVSITFLDGTDYFWEDPIDISSTKWGASMVYIDGNDVDLNGGDSERILYSEFPLTVDDVNFEEGYTALDGAAILGNDSVTVTNSYFAENHADDDGGAIYSTEGILSITDSVFLNNSAKFQGGAAYFSDNAIIIGTTFTSNISSEGGAIFGWGADPWAPMTVETSNFISNSAVNEGGAISTSFAYVESSTFSSNVSGTDGGAIYGYGVSAEGATFNTNSSSFDGGAIAGAYSYISNSNFTSNTADGGGAVRNYQWTTVEGSSFTSNTATDGSGGAISANEGYVRFSTFDTNSATGDGGAIFASGPDAEVESRYSTFDGNSATGNYSDGGAIFSAYYAFAGVSTFVGNSSDEGGAIASNTIDLVLNTFLDNTASDPYYEGEQAVEVWGTADTIGGNIFASSEGTDRQIYIDSFPDGNYLYNLSTGNDFPTAAYSQQVTFSSLGLSDSLASAEGDPTETLALSNGSVAIDFVPRDYAEYISEDFNLGTYVGYDGDLMQAIYEFSDQRGELRLGVFDAGSYEFGEFVPTSTPFTPPFAVLDIKPVSTQAGSIIQATGVNLTRVTEVYVNGIKVVITSKAGSSLSFIAPAGLTGLADVRFVGEGFELTKEDALNFGSALVAGDKAKLVVPGFRANSSKLTKPMKKAIRQFLAQNPELTTVSCKGFTSAPATPRDLRLARQRGKATCDYIQKLNPELTVKVLKGSHTDVPGSQIRRVRIILE